MIRLTRGRARLLALLAAATLGAATTPALAQDTSAVAVNTKDGSTLFKFAFSVRQIMGDVVDQTNAAVAYASCNECTTVAISIQILLVSGSPDQVTPTNLAVALNEDCTECQTLASAYQFVFGNGEELRFTADGRKQIADIRKRFLALRKSGLTTDEIKAQADALAQELRGVLVNEVTVRGNADKKEKEPKSGATGDDASKNADPAADQGSGASGPTAAGGTATTPSPSQTTPTQTAPSQTAPSSTTPTQSTPTTAPTTTTPPASSGTTAP